MRALLVGMEWFPNRAGGLNRYFYEEVHALPSAGVGGTAVVTDLKPGQSAPLTLQPMATEGAPLRRRWRGARHAVQNALREKTHLVNAHFALYAYPWLRDLPPTMPLVINFQGPWAGEILAESPTIKGRARALVAHRIERAVYRRAQRLITLSDAFRDIAHKRYKIPLERIAVVPGGVEIALYQNAPERALARECLGWPQDRPILLAVRRLARRMGLEGLIEALAMVRRDHPHVLLLIGGKGAIAAELEARIQAQGLADNVRLLGFVPDADLPLAYAAANLTIVPTVSLEGFGLVTVESLASGTPVLGTPVGGTTEILRALDAELIFDAPTPEAMAERIGAALAGKIPLPDRAACRAFAQRYSWSEVIPRIRSVFEEASSMI